jgi:hypothetical protein
LKPLLHFEDPVPNPQGRLPPLLNYAAQALYLVPRLRRSRESTTPRSRAWRQFQAKPGATVLLPMPPLPPLGYR